MRFKAAVVLLLTVLCEGCVPRVDLAPVRAAQASLKPTVTTSEDMNFVSLALPSKTPVPLTVQDETFDFGADGVSYFKAFELPQVAGSYSLIVESERFVYDCIPCTSAIFIPKVLLLDSNRTQLEPPALNGPVYSHPVDADLRRVWVVVTPEMGARYAIIFTTREALARGEESSGATGMTAVMVGSTFVPIPGGTFTYHSEGAPIGPVSIELEITDP